MTRAPYRKLGDLLELDLDLVDVDPKAHYDIAGVYGFGRGVFARPPISGADTSYRRLNRVHRNQLVLSRLKAFEGAVSVVPDKFDGWYLSQEFPTFRCVEGELDPGYLAHICRWPKFWSVLAETSTGIGARRERVHPERLLDLCLAIPEIQEQTRLATWLDRIHSMSIGVSSKINAADRMTDALSVSTCARPDLPDEVKRLEGWREVQLRSIMSPASESVAVKPSETYRNLGIYSFGKGLFEKPQIDGGSTSARMLYRVRTGQFIYSRLFAFEGAYASVTPAFDGYYVSNEFPMFDVDPDQLDARWLATYLRSPSHWADLASSSKGLGVRRQRIPVDAVLAYRVFLPPLRKQRSMMASLERLESVQVARRKVHERTESLVPSVLNRAFAALT